MQTRIYVVRHVEVYMGVGLGAAVHNIVFRRKNDIFEYVIFWLKVIDDTIFQK